MKEPKRKAYGERVFPFIPSCGEAPKSIRDLIAETGLTRSQVKEGVEWLRDTFPDWPLLSSSDGYEFSVDEDRVNDFRVMRMQYAGTHVRRTWDGAVKPYLDYLAKTDRVASQLVCSIMENQFRSLVDGLATLARHRG